MCSGNCGPTCICENVDVPNGATGAAGDSAYQVWLNNNNSGTEADYLASLQGAQGTPGAAATIAVGTVSSVAAGDPATVVNSGTSAAAIFDFEIPAGATGADGDNAYAVLTAPFNQPAVGANVFIAGAAGAFNWMVAGQYIFIDVGGFYEVVSTFNGGANANITNTGYAADGIFGGNAAPGAAVASGGGVSPAGVRGPAGAASVVAGPVGPVPNVFFTAAFDATAPAAGAGIQIVNAGAGAGNLYTYQGAGPWAGPYNINGTNGTITTFGTELPNTLAPGVGNVGDYRIRVSAGTPAVLLDMWVKIDNTPTWNLVGSFPNAGGSDDQTFTAVKTSTQPIPFTNTDTLVTVENDSVSPGRDPSGVWNGSVCTFTAAATAIQVIARDFSMRRSSGTQVVTFTAHIYHRPFSTGIDVSIGSATFVYTGAAETTITNPLIVSSTTNFAIGDQLRLVIDPSVAPTDTFNVVITPAALRFYTQAI